MSAQDQLIGALKVKDGLFVGDESAAKVLLKERNRIVSL